MPPHRHLKSLESLELCACHVGASGVACVGRGEGLEPLKKLRLSRNQSGRPEQCGLPSGLISALTDLDVEYGPISVTMGSRHGRISAYSDLRALNLTGNGIGPFGVKALPPTASGRPAMVGLGRNRLGDRRRAGADGAAATAAVAMAGA